MQIPSLSSGLSSLLPNAGLGNGQGLSLGRQRDRSRGEASGTGASPGWRHKVDNDTAETFSAEIMRRLEMAQASNAGVSLASNAGSAASNLQNALTDTVNYVRDNFGDAAATAVMGIVFKGVGDGQGGEDALGDSLVTALKFIDRNFGMAAGDQAMAHFNGALNDAVNGYFQNGRNEMFYASDGSGGSASQIQNVLSATLSDVAGRFGDDAAQAVSDLITKSLEKTGVTRKGLSAALDAAKSYLDAAYGQTELAAAIPIQTTIAKGTVLDVAV